METVIKRADLKDIDILVRWRMEVLHEVFPASQYCFPENLEEENRKYYERALPAGEHIACFAYMGDEIIGCGGMCLYQEMPSPDNPSGQCAYLMNIYCRARYREQGVGRAVVRWLVARAGEMDITKIYLETSGDGRRLYESSGFADMPDMMKFTGRNADIF